MNKNDAENKLLHNKKNMLIMCKRSLNSKTLSLGRSCSMGISGDCILKNVMHSIIDINSISEVMMYIIQELFNNFKRK